MSMTLRKTLVVLLIIVINTCVYAIESQFENVDLADNNRVNPKFINKELLAKILQKIGKKRESGQNFLAKSDYLKYNFLTLK